MYKCSFGIKNFNKNTVNPFVNKGSEKSKNSPVVQINKNDLNKIFNLSRTSLKLLVYFITYYNHTKNTIYFDLKHCKQFTGFNDKRSIYNALNELLGEQIIARTNNENLYYLNTGIITTSE